MPANQSRPHLLAYDIADPRRLSRVHRSVKAYGMPLQYSVFLILASSHRLDQLLAELDAIIDPRADDIRVYPLPMRFDAEHFGRQWFPAGVDTSQAAPFTEALQALIEQQAVAESHP